MCGIIGYAGHRPAVPVIIEGLRRLEYRGYDDVRLFRSSSKACGALNTAGTIPLESVLFRGGNSRSSRLRANWRLLKKSSPTIPTLSP